VSTKDIKQTEIINSLRDRGISARSATRAARALKDTLDGRRRENKVATHQRDAARANRNEVIIERNLLLALLTQQYEAHVTELEDKRFWGWALCLHTPAGHLAWKITDDERQTVFAHVEAAPNDWVRMTHGEKIDGLKRLVGELQ